MNYSWTERGKMEKTEIKLIRDRIRGTEGIRKQVTPEEGKELLYDKLREEILELKESNFEDIYEYADVLEVLYELMARNNISRRDVEKARIKKLLDRGGFRENYVL